jgi:hypothetical protein
MVAGRWMANERNDGRWPLADGRDSEAPVYKARPPLVDHRDSMDKLQDPVSPQDPPARELLVSNAGVVILHPFLIQFFSNCGWLKKQEFTDANTRTSAVLMLHYLASGETEVPEHQLIFPKLLCGMPWEVSLEAIEPFSNDLLAAAEELLASVVKHWSALRNSSPDGLREAFLRRGGKLEWTEDTWRLEVEQKTQDVLLGKLPWGLSIIKFPWMKRRLSVYWQ